MADEVKRVADPDKETRSRNGHRSAATKYINEAKPLLDLPMEQLTSGQRDQLENLQVSLNRKQADLEKKNAAIEELTKADDLDAELDIAEGYISAVQFARDDIARHLSRVDKAIADAQLAATPTPPPAPRHLPVDQLRLPKLELPSFSGSYTEWTSFWDIFEASVNRNLTLSDSQKLNYLKAVLKGESAHLIAALPMPVNLSHGNYCKIGTTMNDPSSALMFTLYATIQL
jgi:hypothetical protein